MVIGGLLGSGGGGGLDESSVSTKRAKLSGASRCIGGKRNQWGSLGGGGGGGLNLSGNAHPRRWRDLIVVNGILVTG
jgi:hypothetical protein